MYIIVWKYKIKPKFKDKFESDYGSSGVWNNLFSQSKNYKGSQLHHDVLDPHTYLLIDTWTDQISYEDFKKENSIRYEQQSKDFESLYYTEELIGSYSSL